jgi:hypothetical protein
MGANALPNTGAVIERQRARSRCSTGLMPGRKQKSWYFGVRRSA